MAETGIEIIEILWVFLWSGFKYVVGVGSAIAYDLGFTISVISAFLGGITGVSVYIFFGESIRKGWSRWFPSKRKVTRTRRFVVRLKQRGGLWAIAFLTPLILSVPLGTFAAVAIGYPWPRIMLAMSISFAFWSLLLFGLYDIIGFNLNEFVRELW